MQVRQVNSVNSSLNKGNPNFGHTFRVSICTQTADGVYTYISPAKNTKLYKKLNKKIVGFLNEDFISQLRKVIGIPRKVVKKKTQTEAKLQKELVEKLSAIDSDYRQASFVRSAYSTKGKLGYIATGVDAPIIEEFMGADGIGVAKRLARESGKPIWETDARSVVEKFNSKVREYVKSPTQLLRSDDNHETMLKVVFSEIPGKRGGKPKYEIASFDFKELKTKPLPGLKETDEAIKKQISLDWAVGRFLKHSFDKIYDKNQSKMTPQAALDVRDKFTAFVSKKLNISHDLPVK